METTCEVGASADSQKDTISYHCDPLSGFWRRIFAFVIDMAILGAIGVTLGTLFYDFFARLGWLGLLFGFTIALVYFGTLNSSLGNGQSVGKRLLKILVVDRDRRTISPLRSAVRFSIIGLPYFLNGAPVPPSLMANPLTSLLLGITVFFGGGSIAYLYIFNRKTRQSLHDLVTGTYVIHTSSPPEMAFEPIWKGHYRIVGAIFALVIVMMTVVVPRVGKSKPFSDMLAAQQAIQDSGLVHTSSVNVGKTLFRGWGTGTSETAFLSANAVLKERPADYNRTVRAIASVVLRAYPQAMQKDFIVISVMYGYDIGIASGWRSQRTQHAPKEWQELLPPKESTKPI